MAEETAPEIVDPNTTVATVDMEVENAVESKEKRSREEEEEESKDEDAVSKKPKVDEEKSVEEQRLEKLEKNEDEEEKEKEASGAVNLGPKKFDSSLEMFHYFHKFLHAWPQNLNVNKYEHTMLLELLRNGHSEPDKKIGVGICAFQVRDHPRYNSRCYFLIREDDSVDDFSFRKCVDHISPLPEGMQLKSEVNKRFGGGGGKHHGGGRGRGGRGGGRGRGGRGRY
ncbi:protein EMBRYO DEFECTIVE 514-like [Trifolium pratense]|uniref:protein EMBRYO DEFECTIVE 514-like n=1 Tax=Trifolium pratense TaxID=57577 RepID=UPI001E6976C2|nr:protein EMBRYO DEFECTIVE 514-like [Trifolium pratense]